MNDRFLLLIQTVLDQKGVKTDYNKIKQMFDKDPAKINAVMDMSATKTEINKFIKEYAPQLQKMFSNIGVEVDLKDLETSMKSVFNESEKAAKSLANAEKQAYEMNKTFDKQRLDAKNKMHSDEIAAYKENEVYDKKQYLIREQAYEMNKTFNQKAIAEQKRSVVATEQAYKTNTKLNDSIEITKTRSTGAINGLNAYVKTLRPQALKDNANKIREISDAFSESAKTGNKVNYSKATASLSAFKSEMKSAGNETASFSQLIKENLSAFTNWYLIGGAVSSLIGNFKSAVGTIVEVDTQLTEISKTSNLSGEALKKLGIDAYDSASKYGTTVQSYLSGYLEMSRGTDEATAKALASLSILAQSAGDMTAELANNYIVATNAAYGYNNEVSKLTSALDGANQITNRNQVSMTDLATATSVAGSQASQSGVAIDQMTAATGTMIATTKQGGEVAGRAFKAILMNLSKVSGEMDGEVFNEDSFKKAEKALSNVGVATEEIVDGTAKLRDPMQILKELAEVYNSLPDDSVKKSNIINDLGGKHYGNQLSSFLSNYDSYTKMLGDYQNSSGSAAAEAQKTADSIKGRLNELSNTWNKTVANVVDSDLLKTFTSIGSVIIDVVDKTSLLQTAMVGLMGFGALKGGSALLSWFNNASTSATMLGNAMKAVSTTGFDATTDNLTNALTGLNSKQMLTVLSTESLQTSLKGLSREQLVSTLYASGLSQAEAETTAATLVMSTAQKTATGSTFSLSASLKGLRATIAANPIGAIITGITIAISALSFISNDAKQSQEEYIAKTKENAETSKTLTSEISELTTKYNDLSEEVKTNSDVKNDFLSTQKDLLLKLGLEGESIDTLIKKYGTLDEAIKQATLSQLEQSKSTLKDKYNLSKDDLEKYKNEDGLSFDVTTKEGNRDYSKNDIKAIEKLFESDIVEKLNGNWLTENMGMSDSNIQAYTLKNVDTSSFEGILDYYEKIDTAITTLSNSGMTTDELDNGIFKSLKKEYDDLKIYIDEHNKDILNLNTNLVASLSGGAVPKTQEEFDSFKNSLLNSAMASNEFVGSQDQIKASIDNFLTTKPEYTKFYDTVVESSEKGKTANKSFANSFFTGDESESFDNFQSQIKQVSESINNISTLDSSSIMDLMQSFGNTIDWSSYINGTESLDSVLQRLYSTLINNAQNAFPEFSSQIAEIGKASLNASYDIESVVEELSYLKDVLSRVKNGQSISLEEMASLINKYNELSGAVEVTANGYSIEEDALTSLINSHVSSANIGISAEIQLTQNEIINTKARIEANKAEIQSLIALAQARGESQSQTMQFLGGQSVVGAQNVGNAINSNAVDTGKLKELESRLSELQSGLGTVGKTKIGGKDKTKGSGGNDKVKNEFSEIVNWIDTAIDVANDRISKRKALTSSSSYNDKVDFYKTDFEDQNKLKKTYDSAEKYYTKKRNSISFKGKESKYLKLVQNGAMKIENIKDEELANKIKQYQDFTDKINDSAKGIQTANEAIRNAQKEILQIKVDKLNDALDRQLNLNSAYDDYLELKGDNLSKSDYEGSINNSNVEIDYRTKINNELKNNLALEKKGSEAYKEITSQINSNESAIRNCVKEQKDWNAAILALPIKGLESQQEDIERELKIREKELKVIQEEIESANNLKDAYDTVVSTVVSALDDEINRRQEVISKMQEQNDEAQFAYDLQQKQWNLTKAMNEKTQKIILSDGSVQYQANQDSIRSAQKELSDKEFEAKIKALEKEIEPLEKYKEQWENSSSEYTKEKDVNTTAGILGGDWLSKIMSLNTGMINQFASIYSDNDRYIDNKTEISDHMNKEIEEINTVASNISDKIESINKTIQAYKNMEITFNGAVGTIKSTASYATGTKNAKTGWANVNEHGTEILQTNQGTLIPLKGGETIFNALESANLAYWSKFNPSSLMSNLSAIQPRNTQQPISISIGDIHCNGVQNVNQLSSDIIKLLPNAILQKINTKG